MTAEALLMAATVWYVPGWMRSEMSQERVMTAMSNAFPKAEIAFKAWDGDKAVWPMAVESADKEAWRLTTHCRIPTPDRKCVAWGGKDEMIAAFEKVKQQVK